ncbi:hypothetical protein [Nonomuraea basaltis]|uniref:hypothetical protein n=1 Tax=Nonomuraea basaltis TaxID=2495887 RepID=UPI00110C4A28|nr:hypothetical protein [Nonomuraea basaltis]TMR90598.1 hypothetical protein EJK15_54400 [Nonomuraea basaltis]
MASVTKRIITSIGIAGAASMLIIAPSSPAHTASSTATALAPAAQAADARVGNDTAKAAHRKVVWKRRSGCTWLFESSHTGAFTKKVQGSCTGHSWLYVQTTTGWKSGWIHRSGSNQAGFSIHAYSKEQRKRIGKVKFTWHKTQRNETAQLIQH